jgi:hypothetical protein
MKNAKDKLNRNAAQDAARDAHARTELLNKTKHQTFAADIDAGYTGSVLYQVSGHGSTALVRIHESAHVPFMHLFDRFSADLQRMIAPSTGTNPIYGIRTYPVLVSPVVTPSEMLNTVRNTFMLNVSEAAKVFHVTRPTIYQWVNLTNIDLMRAHNDRERMKELYRLSLNWKKLGKLSGRWTSQVLRFGQSVIDLLSADTIDHDAVLNAHTQLWVAVSSLQDAELVRSVNAAKALSKAFDRLALLEKERKGGRS